MLLKKATISGLSCCFLFLVNLAFMHDMRCQAQPVASNERTVLGLEDQWFEAIRTGDAVVFDHLMAADFQAITNLGRRLGKNGWLAVFALRPTATGSAIPRKWKITLRDLKVREYPGVVLIDGIAEMETQHYSEAYSHVWIANAAGWRLAMTQSTTMVISPMK